MKIKQNSLARATNLLSLNNVLSSGNHVFMRVPGLFYGIR